MDRGNRGRGRGLPTTQQNVWTKRTEQQVSNAAPSPTVKKSSGGSRKFEEACAEIKANVDKHVAKMARESVDDSDSGEDEDNNLNENDIISTVFGGYGQKDGSEISRTAQVLKDSLRSGAAVCLICIASVKKSEALWSCSKCYCSMHLTCIQRWAKDSIYFQSEAAADHLPPGQVVDSKKFNWCCPKCRAEYSQQSIPTRYLCFCEKVQDPRFDPWLVPHSCGSVCGKLLQPQCSHTCLLLCHPGPCPPCPQTVSVKCYCTKSGAQVRRCSAQTWSCDKVCSSLLSCREHRCNAICHPPPCLPCPRKSSQKCLCGSRAEERPCQDIEFQCSKVCGKRLDCGHHTCDVVCHKGDCGPCPLSLQRTCPCGKKAVTVSCTVDIGGCGDTCDKPLDCELHFCAERCHKGKCGTCLQMRVKRCHCGLKEKELPCYKDFHCETKCKRMKDCRRHPCNRKCCTGNCLPCDLPCNKPLGCKNHKCASRCHPGSCYPCNLTVDVTCACGKTFITVPCGREKQTKPPKCSLLCKKPPDCHHTKRTEHICHFGSCPPCRQICSKIQQPCGHECKVSCHTSVLVQIAAPQQQRAGPWEPKQGPRMEIQELPCPPCPVPMPVTCLGGHETSDWPCHMAVPSSCGRPCGRTLYCTNHTCAKPCHAVTGKGPKNCELCEAPCSKTRPGCTHPCARGPCHPGKCPPCTLMAKHSCHCGLNPQLIRCSELSECIASGAVTAREQLLSCKDRCPKLLSCGHRCGMSCHSGPCPETRDCVTTVHVSCPCKRIKKGVACNLLKQQSIDCNEACQRKKEQELKLKEEKERAQREEEERRNRIELEQFQRKFEKGRSKDRRRPEVEAVAPSRPVYLYLLGAAIPLLSAFFALWWMNA